MAKLINAMAYFMMVILFVACGKSELEEMAENGQMSTPDYYIPTGNGTVDVIFKDGTKKAEKHQLTLTAQDTIKVAGNEAFAATEELSKMAAESVSFKYNHNTTNIVKVGGLKMEYKHLGKDYVLECGVELLVVGSREVVEEETAPLYYELSKTHYELETATVSGIAKATQVFEVEEGYVPPTFVETQWNYEHVAYRRAATLVNSIVTVVCDNKANFADLYDDGSKQNEETVEYIVNNKFNFSAPVIKVDDKNTVVGKTFNFVDDKATVFGTSVQATWISAKVEGKVMHNAKDYASEIVACVAKARTITFASESEATVKFYDSNAEDYAEVTVPVTVEENRKLVETTKDFVHEAYRRVANVVNNVISVVCDNRADFVDKYSDNTTEPETVKYIVTNNFSLTMPEKFVIEKASDFIGKTYDFNAGTAVVNGYNVIVTFSNRVIADIMHNSKNYKGEAPVCEVIAKSITFTSMTDAVIRFEDSDDANDYSEATVAIKVIEAEIIDGMIVGGWMTDAYMRQIGKQDRTDLHVLAQKNGSYVVYSRPENGGAWTVTSLTATEGQAVVDSGRALAWIWNNITNAYELGTVEVIEREDEEERYILDYYTLGGNFAYRLGKANEAIGQPWRKAIRGTLVEENGIWTIKSIDSEVPFYFVSSK